VAIFREPDPEALEAHEGDDRRERARPESETPDKLCKVEVTSKPELTVPDEDERVKA
jgi:hypothetical protein